MNHSGLKDLAIRDTIVRESMASENPVDIVFSEHPVGGVIG
jgi:hypothetical protein